MLGLPLEAREKVGSVGAGCLGEGGSGRSLWEWRSLVVW